MNIEDFKKADHGERVAYFNKFHGGETSEEWLERAKGQSRVYKWLDVLVPLGCGVLAGFVILHFLEKLGWW